MTFCGEAAANGAILHPRHNWFLSAAHTDADIDRALEATELASAPCGLPRYQLRSLFDIVSTSAEGSRRSIARYT